MECEVNLYTNRDTQKGYGVYCKEHYDSLFEDLMNDIMDPVGPDYDDLED